MFRNLVLFLDFSLPGALPSASCHLPVEMCLLSPLSQWDYLTTVWQNLPAKVFLSWAISRSRVPEKSVYWSYLKSPFLGLDLFLSGHSISQDKHGFIFSPTVFLLSSFLCWGCNPVPYTVYPSVLPYNSIPRLKVSIPSKHLPFFIQLYSCVCIMRAHLCVQKSTLNVFLNCPPSYFLKQRLLLRMELAS